jgi:hypothetical protein
MLISVKKHALVEDFVHNINLDGHHMMDNYDDMNDELSSG